jgi:3-deoxy-manno-octulosonate cytidylyltransferase (CMP-KDO synthetase)
MTDFIVVIPARMGSERLPGKPLLELGGRPMIERVQERAWASGAARVLVATDDERVAAAARRSGGEGYVTSGEHPTGTDRIAEVCRYLELDDDAIVVNLQGDEPLMPPELLTIAADALHRHATADVATLATPLARGLIDDPSAVKVVLDSRGYALYFSRAAIPWPREEPAESVWHRHLGLYAYRAGFLHRFPALQVPDIECLERLEQLRALWHGYRIHVTTIAEAPEAGVDTPADLARVAAHYAGR